MAKVVNPNNATHKFLFLPRFEVSGILSLYLKNEATEVETEVTSPVFETGTNDIMTATFDFTFVERDKYQIRIMHDDGQIAYRGKLFATEQETQNFVITEGYIKY